MYLKKEGSELTREDVLNFKHKYEEMYSPEMFPIVQNFKLDITVNQHKRKNNIMHWIKEVEDWFITEEIFKSYMNIVNISCQLKLNPEEKECIEINISLI